MGLIKHEVTVRLADGTGEHQRFISWAPSASAAIDQAESRYRHAHHLPVDVPLAVSITGGVQRVIRCAR